MKNSFFAYTALTMAAMGGNYPHDIPYNTTKPTTNYPTFSFKDEEENRVYNIEAINDIAAKAKFDRIMLKKQRKSK